MVNNQELQARICSVRAADGGSHLLLTAKVCEAGEERQETLVLLTARLSHMPHVGEVDSAEWLELCREAEISSAMDAGLRCLGAGGSSRRRLIEKLRLRGFSAEIAGIATAELAEKGYLREEESALREAEKGMAKLWGNRRILADLSAKGYHGGALKYAEAALRSEDSVIRCAKLIRKRRMVLPTDEAEARKFFAALMRYGYSAEEIKKAVRN